MKRFLFLVLGIFMISSVVALEVSPARTTVNFKPGLKKDIGFEVINSGGQDVDLALSAQGELKDYIHVSSSIIHVSSSEKSKKFSYSIALPEKLSPGLHTGEVLLAEDSGKVVSDGSYIQATLAVAIQLHVYVPYPGKYATAKMYIYGASQGGNVKFVIPVVNAGKFDLTSVGANVDIYNKLNEKVDSFDTDSISIKSGERKELSYSWKSDVPIGDYIAKASLIYDEGIINLEENFSVGTRDLELQEINVNDFNLGQIVKLEMLVENKWSEMISGAYIKTKIKDSSGNVVSSFDSAAYDIPALSKQTFLSYWDTAGVKTGTYDADVSINYADKTFKKNLEFDVSENNLKVIGLGYVISDSGGNGTNNLVVVLIVVIFVLVAINLLWFLLLRKKLAK